MNAYELSKAGINVSEGVRRFNGNAAVFEKILKKYPGDPNYAAMCSAIAAGDAHAAFSAAHTLKGVAGNLSLTRLCDDIHPLVEELRGGSLAHAPALLEPVAQDQRAILRALSQDN